MEYYGVCNARAVVFFAGRSGYTTEQAATENGIGVTQVRMAALRCVHTIVCNVPAMSFCLQILSTPKI